MKWKMIRRKGSTHFPAIHLPRSGPPGGSVPAGQSVRMDEEWVTMRGLSWGFMGGTFASHSQDRCGERSLPRAGASRTVAENGPCRETVNRGNENQRAHSITDVFDWSRPFHPQAIQPDILALMDLANGCDPHQGQDGPIENRARASQRPRRNEAGAPSAPPAPPLRTSTPTRTPKRSPSPCTAWSLPGTPPPLRIDDWRNFMALCPADPPHRADLSDRSH